MSTVLVVDDEFDTTSALRAVLELEGYAVDTCANGREALEYLTYTVPSVILLDVMMPFMSGLEVLRRIRDNGSLRDTKVILMSGVPPRDNGASYDSFLQKPFDLQTLLREVGRFTSNGLKPQGNPGFDPSRSRGT